MTTKMGVLATAIVMCSCSGSRPEIKIGEGPGTAELTWDPVTTDTDGNALTNLGGYRVYHGVAPGTYDSPVDIGNVTTSTLSGLAAATTHYFTVTAYNLTGDESMQAMEASKLIP